MEFIEAVVQPDIEVEVDVEAHRDQPRRGRRRAEVDPQVESFMRSSMLRFTRVIQERNNYQTLAQERLARVRVLEGERLDMISNFERMNANCQASIFSETHVLLGQRSPHLNFCRRS